MPKTIAKDASSQPPTNKVADNSKDIAKGTKISKRQQTLLVKESIKDSSSTCSNTQDSSDTHKGGALTLMLAKVHEQDKQDPTGWLMSEKLDGVRCFWNGRNMYTRNGNLFYPPTWFKDALPKDVALDGELWTKRNDF